MAYKKKNSVNIDMACPHTIKKFELIEAYVQEWALKLLNFNKCDGIVFIDCMCNSGVYHDNDGREVFGTPIRIAMLLSNMMKAHPEKHAWLYFNDLSAEKIDILKTHLPNDEKNYHIVTSSGDGNDLLRKIAGKSHQNSNINHLLVYDPYTASVDWTALMPFLRNWGEVIINHMVSDPIRGLSQAKSDAAIEKYEKTYLASIEKLATFGNDKCAYENRVQEIIVTLRGIATRKYYIASFPFFNTKNVLVYNLIHCSANIKGFRLFKRTAWKIFGGKSSMKDTHGMENQLLLDLDGSGSPRTVADEYCYYVKDIVEYLHEKFRGRKNVSLDDAWGALDEHPVFPSEGYRTKIKQGLKNYFDDIVSQKTISFSDRRL